MNHLEGLNSAQQDAVLTIDGPLLVLAGAGAGKTRVIARRILEIISRGGAPEKILAITFTNKAAGEKRARITPGVFVSAFHSLGLTLIKENLAALGYRRTPAIYDRGDSLREMKRALKSVGADEIEPRSALAVASRMKGEGVDAEEFAAGAGNPYERQIALAWLAYEQALREDRALDFDDLLVSPVKLLKKNPEIREKYLARWCYIHIDEYQDTNAIQAELAWLLVGQEKNICVVGDPDQTIYSWRGANVENIMTFLTKYAPEVSAPLNQNYRSTQNILEAANSVISKNTKRFEKKMTTANPDGEALSLYQAFDETDEAGFIARIIKEQLAEGGRPKNFAVLYRANFQSRAIEEQLLAANIPYQVLGTKFYDRKEVKDALAFVHAALYETPAELGRVIDTLPGLGKITKLKILAGREHELKGSIGERVARMRRLLAKIKETAGSPPADLLRFVISQSGMERTYKEDKIEGAERLENLRELASLASRYASVEDFLESVALMSDQDALKNEWDAVRLMTVHASKGLEFPTVFIAGLEEGLFPYDSTNLEQDARDPEEERRLMYVALTRAQQKVYLSYAMTRTVFGSKKITEPSRFIKDLEDAGDLLQKENSERLKTIYL